MLKLTFKNVGQGDSIIIEWQEEDVRKIAIIDCNFYNNRNPVLDHLIENEYKEIEYIILSHPHYDHYSGINEIIKHFAEKSYSIKYFLHTSIQVPDFLKMAAKSAIAEKELQELFLSLRANKDILNMKVSPIQSDLPVNEIPLGKEYNMTILSPSITELDNYRKNIPVFQSEEDGVNNPNANWLSTILKINAPDFYVLLTSDAEKSSLVRIDRKKSQELEKQLYIGQSPHHGSKSNHSNAFWRKRNRRDDTSIVFSVGENSYSHPSKEAVDFFSKNNFELFSTNHIGGLLDLNEESKINSSFLDIYSTLEIIDSKLSGHKEFNI